MPSEGSRLGDSDPRQPLLRRSSLEELDPSTTGGDLPRPNTSGETEPDAGSSSLSIWKKNTLKMNSGVAIEGLALVFVVLIWSLVLSAMPPSQFSLFGWHPLLQSLGLIFLVQSILVLQPTTGSRPNEKKAAFNVHQLVNLALVLPVFTIGATIMWYLHHPASHFISWHGVLGTTVVIWMWIQAVIGAATVWAKGKAVGGETRAKGLWKWHRLSGYILLPLFAITLFTGATQTSWTQQQASMAHHVAVTVVLVLIVIAVGMRVQTSKLPKLSSGR